MMKSAPPKTDAQRAKQKRKRQRRSVAKRQALELKLGTRAVDAANHNAQHRFFQSLDSKQSRYPIDDYKTRDRGFVSRSGHIDIAALTTEFGPILRLSAQMKVRRVSEPDLDEKKIVPAILSSAIKPEIVDWEHPELDSPPSMSKEEELRKVLALAKGLIFKADRTYRCRLGFQNSIQTTSGGVVATQLNVSSVVSSVEWSVIDQLFDEIFIHSMTVNYQPHNLGGIGVNGSAGTGARENVNTTSNTTSPLSVGLIMASYFGNVGAPATAAAMTANPNRKIAHSGSPWRYVWRNNVRYDPRGISLDPTSSALGWTGWTEITNANLVGGFMYIRALADIVVGNASAAVFLGSYELSYDVSFRARV